MSNFKLISGAKLKEMLKQRNLWSRMRSGKLRVVEQAIAPAKISLGGTSSIVSYYDKHQNMFTIHRIITKEGKVIHEHVKDAYIAGVYYKVQ